MSIKITNLSFSYPSTNVRLFDDLSVQFTEGWTCVAGSNGSGKSTLLHLIAGMLIPDGGKISSGPGTTQGNVRACDNGGSGVTADAVYCPQECAGMPENLYAAFWSDDNEVRCFFSRLGVTEEMLGRYDSLSGGEKKRVQLACALAEKPAVLLLDEPTNHLDERTSSMIADALREFTGTGIMVSHDRAFADELCTRTVFLYDEASAFAGGQDRIAFDSYPCGLSKALELRRSAGEKSRGEWERLDAKASRERERGARLEAQNQKARARLSKKAVDPRDHDAQAKIDVARISGKDRTTGDAKARLSTQVSRTESERDGVRKALRRKEGFSLSGTDSARPVVIEGTELRAGSYRLKVPHIEIRRGSKLALTGENGAGKTLFVRHVISLMEQAGRAGELLYLPQEIPEDGRRAVLSAFRALEEDGRGEVLSTLYRLGSEPGHLEGADGKLSPGELRKLMIALAVRRPLSLLVLDEPTNHMDITSVLALENALAALDCAMIVVSHDKAFLRKLAGTGLVAVRSGDSGELRLE